MSINKEKNLRNQYNRPDNIRVKARANYCCEKCGSDKMVQAHAPDGDHTDWRRGICLCAECHSKEHPEVPRNLFFTKNQQPYWHNISANVVAKEFGCHTRTVIRAAKRLAIPMGAELSASAKIRIRNEMPNLHKEARNAEIVRLFDGGRRLTHRQIAEKFGMGLSAVSMVIVRSTSKLKKAESDGKAEATDGRQNTI